MNKQEIIIQTMSKIDSEQIIDLAKKLIQIPSVTGTEKVVAD